LKSRAIDIIAISTTLIVIAALGSFVKISIWPAYFFSTHESQFASLAVECNISVAAALESREISGSVDVAAFGTANNVSMVACHDLDVLASQMLSRGVSPFKLREIYLQSLEDERLPLWMLAEPPSFRWEK